MSAALRLPVIVDEVAPVRPRTRGDCIDGPRPCPWVSCWHHLLPGHVGEKATHQADTSDEALLAVLESMPHTCDLDAADRGGATLEEIAQSFSVTREWIRQIESKALKHLDRRVDHLRDVIVEEHASEFRPARCGPVPASESRGWTDPSPRYAHLPGPADVTDAAQEFWCGHMAVALTGRLCTRRHLARGKGSAMSGAAGQSYPTYPDCARCADGAQIAARVGVPEVVAPQREATPAAPALAPKADTAPATMGAEEPNTMKVLKAPRDESPARDVSLANAARVTAPAPGAVCSAWGCTEPPQGYRAELDPLLRPLCKRHRLLAQQERVKKVLSVQEAVDTILRRAAQSGPEPVPALEPVAVLALPDADLDVLEEASAKVSFDAAAHALALEEQNAAAARLREERDLAVAALQEQIATATRQGEERELAVAALARVREELERDQAALRDATSAAANLREENGWLLSQRDSARAEVEALRDQIAAARADAETLRRDRDALAVAQQHAAERIAELEGQQLADATYRTEMPRPLARLAALVKALAPARETVAFEIEESSSPGSWRCAVHRGGELLDSWHHDSETPDEAVGVLVQRAEDIARVRIDELRIALEGA